VRHQRYCDAPECKARSKGESQRRWKTKAPNRDVYCGYANVQRVRQWRKEHPGYWRRKGGALREICQMQPVDNQCANKELTPEIFVEKPALRDFCLSQQPLFVGFVAHLTGALRENIAEQLARFQNYGQQILGKGPGVGR
jgi:hypothetical protein